METLDTYSRSNNASPLEDLKPKFTFLWISVAFTSIFLVYFFWAYGQLFEFISANAGNMENLDRIDSLDKRLEMREDLGSMGIHLAIGGLLSFAAGVCAIVSVCIFYSKACKNMYSYGLKDISFTPGWCVGWFFIPFANLVMPLLVSNQIWKGSVGIAENQEGNQWKNNKLSPWVIIWYSAFIGRIVFSIFLSVRMQASLIMMDIDRQDEEEVLMAVVPHIKMIFYSSAFFIALQGLAIIMFTKKITEMQASARQ